MATDELVFLPLGGVGEIGMNLGLYGFGRRGRRKWIVVDFGVAFAAEEHLPGVDLILPDIEFLQKERENVEGILITHAHEDHFGALPYLWDRLKVPVYATPFAAGLLAAKLMEEQGATDVPVTVVEIGSRRSFGPFDVEFVPTTHSIPEPTSLIIRTPAGNVLHTADWKIDRDPVIGRPFDPAPFQALGEEGCRAIVCDSTNVLRAGRSQGEGDVAKGLAKVISAAPRRVAVTAFASNVARLRSVAEAAQEAGRTVIVVGRAMKRTIAVARELGFLEGLPQFMGEEHYSRLPRDKVVLLCTGSQGEPRAALTRIARGDHPSISLNAGDTVIYSARMIPGNEREVGSVLNSLVRDGIELVTDEDELVHVSGHPRRDELKDLYGWVRPQAALPVHGEARHLAEHAELARSLGVPEVVTAFNGDMVLLAPGPARIVDEVAAGRLYRDGRVIVPSTAEHVRERRRLSFAGIVTVALAVDDRGDLAADPELSMFGLPELDEEGEPMEDLILDVVEDIWDGLPARRRRDEETVARAVSQGVRNAVQQAWGKKPLCRVLVLPV
ncbi:ribonuclease J [Lutibaculum baratangense]|uniref:Metallo-beta-lactamase family protein, RNA-specific n=1 Tax=Lutibaculum baratangense AMV1 TaxID=631454 RepID=V4QZE5_9HYPH|nr:ribonuclease J [Lutibaculum baratangense]ESR25127.1 Metallo-beta-lactamase family protein, RNA-specific [Lutibaculum baratangense AMV1]